MSRQGSRGQSAVETLAVVPALVLLALAAWWLVAGAAMWLQAGSAARVAARAAAVEPAGAVAAGAAPQEGVLRVRAHRGTDGVGRARAERTLPGPWGPGRIVVRVDAEAAGR
ncbi:MAG TPA: hypothetical protein VNT51_09360 [Miltoncostaeaceae bacterium]|nr:hypothetical protein [Miltoncostaeaceae bacterium]